MKAMKAPGLDGFPAECLKKGGMAVLEWLVRLWYGSVRTASEAVERKCTYGLARYMYSPCTKGRVTSLNVEIREMLVC